MTKQVLALSVLAGFLLFSQGTMLAHQFSGAGPGETVSDQDVQLLRTDLRTAEEVDYCAEYAIDRRTIREVLAVYDAYTQETTKLSDTQYGLIKEYVQGYETMTDGEADSPMNRTARWTNRLHSCNWIGLNKFQEGAHRQASCPVLPTRPPLGPVVDLQPCFGDSDGEAVADLVKQTLMSLRQLRGLNLHVSASGYVEWTRLLV
jgi:hypothetical protein